MKPTNLARGAQLKLVETLAGRVGGLVDPPIGVDFPKGMLMAAAVAYPRAFL
jgi:hypothetical protein